VNDLFDLSGRVAVITGGAGFLGCKHAEAIAGARGIPVLADLDGAAARAQSARIAGEYGVDATGEQVDVRQEGEVEQLLERVLADHGRVDILVNNAANDPKVDGAGAPGWARVEAFPLDVWNEDIAVGLTGAFLCAKVIGGELAQRGRGVVLNVASDLSVIAPDNRLYDDPGLEAGEQPVKPISYAVTKTALLGLTRYLAVYWASAGVRVNAISPGGVYNAQPREFLDRIERLIPLGRMAAHDEYKGAVLFLCSDASSYVTGHNLVADGGRSVW
jgi:NAD(P)-dependent dehydrogenase (short-subunit alcohol dehydrogenase family)